MGGNPAAGTADDGVRYAIRLTFGIVHAVLLTLFSFLFVFLFPALSHWLFGLYGFIVAPALSLVLTLFCNACIDYVCQSDVTATRILQSSWAPPLGVFCVSLVILPLEMMPALGFSGPLQPLVATSFLANFIVVALLQVYAARRLQTSSSESVPPSGSSGPT